jgi:hypothetical protein
MANMPSAAITTNARKLLISVPFQEKGGVAPSPAETIPAGRQ